MTPDQRAVLWACEAFGVTLTEWIVVQVKESVAPSRFSTGAQDLIAKYAPADPEADRQVDELALVTAYALLLIPVLAVWGFLAWMLSGGNRPSNLVVGIGWGAIAVILVGIGLHLIRYYDALFGKARGQGKGRPRLSWPWVSGDLDFLVQIACGLLAVLLGATT